MRAIEYPAYSLDVVEGTLAYIDDLEAMYYYDWPDIRDRNYRFWDSIGREISFELFEGERGPDFRPVIADDAPLIGTELGARKRWAALRKAVRGPPDPGRGTRVVNAIALPARGCPLFS
jgi:hypothetical protein